MSAEDTDMAHTLMGRNTMVLRLALISVCYSSVALLGSTSSHAAPSDTPSSDGAPAAEQLGSRLLHDRGTWDDFREIPGVFAPPFARASACELVLDVEHDAVTLCHRGSPVAVYPAQLPAHDDRGASMELLSLAELGLASDARQDLAQACEGPVALAVPSGSRCALHDKDGDGIADSLDVLVGARNAVSLAPQFVSGFPAIAFPGGDVPRDQGTSVDLLIRALRSAGIDLQSAIVEDMRRRPADYGVKSSTKLNTSLEHRRLRRVLRYFELTWPGDEVLSEPASAPAFRLGDVVFFDEVDGGYGPEAVGVVTGLDAGGTPRFALLTSGLGRAAEVPLPTGLSPSRHFRIERL